ncbi:MAG: AAA family ATPase [Candidatus Nitrosopumilus limneticus]|nr:C predicted [Candidatus Nitrosopumilus limneticus]MDA0669431.1 AAA family ATPase [Thermoproteota archaeon]HJJ21774.1 AAA family ATPase [Nitrosopumilus sp.]MDA0853339.1 AAA family ATPase [Thermoproteota archaeon]MDA1123864.1 AAA family ATPase [Thermoproteota archaeon]
MLSKLLVCLTGMPGAGKSTIAEGLQSKGYQIINLGNAVRNEAKARNLEASRDNLGKLMLELREKNGPGAIAKLVESEIMSSNSNVLLIDGVRSNDEIEILKKFGTVKLLAIHASTDTRFNFLQKRGRTDDPQTKEHFNERDNRELSVGISNSIALSDYAISNIGLTKDELLQKSYEIIQRWIE